MDKWAPYRFLLGEWVGEGSGQPGQGEGSSTFSFELDSTIMVRRSYNHIPATEDRPAVNHEDMMVIYQQRGTPTRAIYWDNEGHTIEYGVEFSPDGKLLTFQTRVRAEAPTFKLTYEKLAADSLRVSFDIAPPGKPDEYSLYTTGVIHRR